MQDEGNGGKLEINFFVKLKAWKILTQQISNKFFRKTIVS